MGSSVYALKNITKVERPDGSGFNSGYLVAAGTGAFRIYNNKHWLTDVAMGAGIGVLSTKIAYWIFPYMNNHIFKSKNNVSSAIIAPFYNGNQMGLGMNLYLK